MQKFPLRMKDNDLLVTELYKDPSNDHITAISVYLTPKTTSKCWKYQSCCFPLCVDSCLRPTHAVTQISLPLTTFVFCL